MQFNSAKVCIFRISIFLVLMGVLVYGLLDILKTAFLYNIQINSVIVVSFMVGVILVYLKLFSYEKEYSKLGNFGKLTKGELQSLKLLRPITLYLSPNNNLISQAKLQTILASIEKKNEDSSSLSKYISGILIFLGLLGTFWGLSHTIGNVANIIDNLGIDQSTAAESFLKLKSSLKIPLSGMGIAFGCSLFGLSSSLILGFLNINQKKVADDFLSKVEEWITKYTVNFDAIDNRQGYHGEVFSMGLLEKTIEMIYIFQKQMKDLEENRGSIMNIQKDLYQKLLELNNIMVAFSKRENDNVLYEMLKKLDLIDISLNKLIEGIFINRDYIVDNLSKEIRFVSKTLSSLIRES